MLLRQTFIQVSLMISFAVVESSDHHSDDEGA